MYNRLELVATLNEALSRYQEENDDDALNALDALGFTVGQIFSCAPDPETRHFGRQYFLAAIEEGMHGGWTVH
jgi:hypothetical protein